MLARARRLFVALTTLAALLAFLVPAPLQVVPGASLAQDLLGATYAADTGASDAFVAPAPPEASAPSNPHDEAEPLRAPPARALRDRSRSPERLAAFVPQTTAAARLDRHRAPRAIPGADGAGDATIATSRMHAECTVLVI